MAALRVSGLLSTALRAGLRRTVTAPRVQVQYRSLHAFAARSRPVVPTALVRQLHISTQDTPNPNSLMFQPGGQDVMGEDGGTVSFSDLATAERAGAVLATRLFQIPGVVLVFYGRDYVSVTKDDSRNWEPVSEEIFAEITQFYATGERDSDGKLIMMNDSDEGMMSSTTEIYDDDDEIVATIKELLDTRIRPVVQEDGGDVVYRGFDYDTGEVSLQLHGACVGCPSSSATLKGGIEQMLQHYVPEITAVKEVVDEEMMLSYKPQPIPPRPSA